MAGVRRCTSGDMQGPTSLTDLAAAEQGMTIAGPAPARAASAARALMDLRDAIAAEGARFSLGELLALRDEGRRG